MQTTKMFFADTASKKYLPYPIVRLLSDQECDRQWKRISLAESWLGKDSVCTICQYRQWKRNSLTKSSPREDGVSTICQYRVYVSNS